MSSIAKYAETFEELLDWWSLSGDLLYYHKEENYDLRCKGEISEDEEVSND